MLLNMETSSEVLATLLCNLWICKIICKNVINVNLIEVTNCERSFFFQI